MGDHRNPLPRDQVLEREGTDRQGLLPGDLGMLVHERIEAFPPAQMVEQDLQGKGRSGKDRLPAGDVRRPSDGGTRSAHRFPS